MPSVVHRKWGPPFVAPAPVYLDSSVLLSWVRARDPLHARALQFIGDHLVAGVDMRVSLLGLDEMLWILLRQLVAQALGVKPETVRLGSALKRKPALLSAHLPALRTAVGHVLSWATLEGGGKSPNPQDVLNSWLDRMNNLGGVHDAWHLALAQELGARSFVTGDHDFRRVKTLPAALQILEL